MSRWRRGKLAFLVIICQVEVLLITLIILGPLSTGTSTAHQAPLIAGSSAESAVIGGIDKWRIPQNVLSTARLTIEMEEYRKGHSYTIEIHRYSN